MLDNGSGLFSLKLNSVEYVKFEENTVLLGMDNR